MDRREFLEVGGGVALVGVASAYAVKFLAEPYGSKPPAADVTDGPKWGMVIDVNKCRAECTACVDACVKENNISHHGDKRWDVHWIRKVKVKEKGQEHAVEKPVLLLCNHCDKPPCAQVCPVQATFKRHDGLVLVDYHRCIGCRYCVVACPYNARFFNFKESETWPNEGYPRRSHGVAEACTLCAHRLEVGENPACMEACKGVGAHAITVGDLSDPESEVSNQITSNAVKRIREDLGTEPRVYYVGL